jgi:acetyl esterase/lipase
MDVETLRRRLLYQIPEMAEAERRRDVSYRQVAGGDLLLDVYRPPSLAADARLPGVVFVHGGPIPADLPLQPKDWGVYESYGALAAASGLVGVTVNHRYFGFSHLETAAGDLSAAIGYVREHAAELLLDPDRLGVWAFSGGGALLGPILERPPPFVRCLVAYYAVLDLRDLPAEYAGGASPEVLRRFSPAAHLRGDAVGQVPIFVARAGLDHPGVNRAVDLFVQEALAANRNLTLANHPRGHHGFDIADDDPRTKEIIAATIEFVNANL